jgi:MFS family permease
MLISLPSGWLSDRYDLKKVMGIGMIFYLGMVALYAFAVDWRWILFAMILSPFTMALMFRSQNIITGNSLEEEDRATGMGIRRMASRIAGIIAPIPAAFMVEHFGGLTVEGIRPMYFIRLTGLVFLYAIVYLKVNTVSPERNSTDGISFVDDFKEVLEGNDGVKAWAAVEALGSITWGIMNPFTLLYAAEYKGANPVTLGIMASTAAFIAIILGVPVNRFSDRKGRKLGILITRPFRYIWLLLLFLAPSPNWLILAWFFRGIGMSSSAWQVMRMELVPKQQRGRWLGMMSTLRSALRIPAPIIGGIIYAGTNPGLVFIIALILDLMLRMPLLIFKVPEPNLEDFVEV